MIMKEELNKILDNVIEWLKFAEAKNAGLIVFNSAAIAGVLQAYPAEPTSLVFFKGVLVAFFSISICISLYTFLPVLKKTFPYQKYEDAKFETEKANLNCYFFNHHSKINCDQLLSLLKYKTGDSDYSHTNVELDIADQIINNAEIAVSKFKLFTSAAYITFAGVFLTLLIIILKLFL
jgi:hypothetical protein